MAEPQSEDEGILREWAPLSGFLHEVPMTVRKGLFLEDVTLTCVDAVPEYLAVGTNIGVVYWYDRATHNMQRLRPEKNQYKITCVSVVSSVDYMVAAGDESGTVSIFRIPKPTPDWISPIYKQNTSTNVERYTVGGLHSAPVSALEWSLNGQKLFSGDTLGLVVFTEIDYYMNLSKACEILNEKYQVVQLSFHQNAQTLLVATEYRCIVAHRQEGSSWRVVQVGQKERRSLYKVGATFFPHPGRPLERIVYSGRAGLRFWQADSEGHVHKTLIFKDAIKKPHQQIHLLRALPPVWERDLLWERAGGPVLAWHGYLVTHNTTSLVVLDPHNISVVASLHGLADLHSLAITTTEIFIITGARNIMRLSYLPDPNPEKQVEPGLSLQDLKVSPVAGTLLDLTSKLKSSASKFVNSHPQTAVNGSLEEDVSPGTEALELDLPPVMPLDSSVQELTVRRDPRIQILDQIGKQSFDDILHSSTRKVKTKSQKHSKGHRLSNGNAPSVMESSCDSVSVKSEESSASEPITRPPSCNNNLPPPIVAEPPQHHQLTLDLVSCSTHLSGSIPPDILPDLRSPDSILKDVHDNEILVAKAFNLEEVLLVDEKDSSQTENGNKQEEPTAVIEPKVAIMEETMSYGPPSGSSSAIPSLEASNPIVQEVIQAARDMNCNRSTGEVLGCTDVADNCISNESWIECNDNWCQVPTPEPAQDLSVCQSYACISGPGRTIHFSTIPTTSWQRLTYRATNIAISPDAKVVWNVDFGVAHALTDLNAQGPNGSNWEVAARGVESVSLGVGCAWYVAGGKVYLQTGLSRNKPHHQPSAVPCPSPLIKVCCSHQMVWVLTSDYWVLWRAGITDECPEGTHWQRITIPSSHVTVGDIALGPHNVGWLIDRSNDIYFSDNYISDDCTWWQILIRGYLYENSSLCQVASSEDALWVTNKTSPYVYVNSTAIKGHRWINVKLAKLTVPLRWRQITAEGVFEEKGSLWLLSSANDLFHLPPNSDTANVVALPCRAEDVSSLSAAPHALWLLTLSGQIHVRQGMGDQCSEGDKWRTLNIEQISSNQVTLRHVSCGCDVIWACDTTGDMCMAVGSPYLIATDTFSPAWVQVDGKPLPNTHFVKVFVGSQTHIVWALDNRNNVYVRSGIFHDFQLGTDWVLVPGLQATQISISGSLVWALSTNGSVFCRFGISENNYIGNCWYQVPGTLCHLTASMSDGLWGVMEKSGCLVMYTTHTLPISEAARQAASADKLSDDWEVI